MVIFKWIKAIFTHPKRLIKSIYYRLNGKEEELSQIRLAICDKCREKRNIIIIGDICGECGCVLANKTRLIDEQCDKWL
jgi:hypothetical protein